MPPSRPCPRAEALQIKDTINNNDWITYKDTTYWEGREIEFKPRINITKEEYQIQWFSYLQLRDKFIKDKEEWGFIKETNELEEGIKYTGKKELSKLYHILLTQVTETEVVKNAMVK
uniref:Uncharacterized protein n=1 Tax=Sphaerodactylus townsendi TaxID=933632 RepID=A0ACB8FF03_9SAUR